MTEIPDDVMKAAEKLLAKDRVEPCGLSSPDYVRCPHMKRTGSDLYGATYHCTVCDNCYDLDYEEMK